MAKLRTRKHKVVLARSKGGDAGITFLLPIMGITLPFISYGGSSLLSYMFLLGIIFNISNESLRFTN